MKRSFANTKEEQKKKKNTEKTTTKRLYIDTVHFISKNNKCNSVKHANNENFYSNFINF